MTATSSWILGARGLALDDAAIATMGILEADGVDVLLIKGPVSAARLYPEAPDARDYCDVDLLVAPDQFDRAQAALARRGYVSGSAGLRPGEIDGREVSWFPPGEVRLAIDLHRSLAWVGEPTALWSKLWRERTSMDLQGHDVQIPDAAGTALIVGLHASRAGSSRKPFRDLARAVALLDESHWRVAIETARECDALTGFALGLDAVPEARPLLARFDLPTTAPRIMRMQAYGAAGVSLGRLMETRGRQARARHIADRIWPSVAFMHKYWPGSRSGPVGLVRAHGQRWGRFVRTLPHGLIELRDAQHGGPAGRDRWTSDALVSVRRQLAESGMEQLHDFRPPGRGATERSVDIILQRNDASCLEGSLVRQRFQSAKGRNVELLVGVVPPQEGFRAHAWLSGDLEEGNESFQIIHRVRPMARTSSAFPFPLAALRYRYKYPRRIQESENNHV